MKYLGFFLCLFACTTLSAAPLRIVAAENFYGSVAEQIGGSSVKVVSIMSNPNQDPHEFQTDAVTAQLIADADIVIYSGIGYDDWMEKLLGVKGKKPNRLVIKVADLIGAKAGDNPHIWYDPKTMLTLATKLAQILNQPRAIALFQQSMHPLLDKIAALKSKTSGIKVTATEPVFGYMAKALGFVMLDYDYQLAVMNNTDPSFQQASNLEKNITTNTAKILFYNSQVTDPSTMQMQSIAKTHGVPIVGVTETQPPHIKSYANWMLSELLEIEKVLDKNDR